MFSTYLDGAIMPDQTVFVPSVVILDEQKQLISATHDVPLKLVEDYCVGQIDLPKPARYLVVYRFDAQHTPLFAYLQNGSRWPVKPTMSG